MNNWTSQYNTKLYRTFTVLLKMYEYFLLGTLDPLKKSQLPRFHVPFWLSNILV